ncbi:MAG TPA: hypothetical protein VGC99_29090 [Candidatus Tectomicrobia bacterium]
MNTPANLPDLPQEPHSHELARYSHELLALSGVLTGADDPTQDLWRRLDHALEKLETRLTRGRDRDKIGKRFSLPEGYSRTIHAMAEHFSCTRSAIIRHFLRQCPVESFPKGWVQKDIQLVAERRAQLDRMIYEQFHHAEEVP